MRRLKPTRDAHSDVLCNERLLQVFLSNRHTPPNAKCAISHFEPWSCLPALKFGCSDKVQHLPNCSLVEPLSNYLFARKVPLNVETENIAQNAVRRQIVLIRLPRSHLPCDALTYA